MKMEFVQSELQQWGELLITTDSGQKYEIHLGDTTFDTNTRMIRIKGEHSDYVIEGDAVAAIEKHYGHAVE